MGDCNTAVCAECLINRKQAYKWDLGDRFRESAGGFFPFVFWFFYSKHISCWRGAEYGPAVSHAGTRVILSWRAPRRSRAGRASCLSLCLSELRLRPAPDRATSSHGCVMVGGPTAAPLHLWGFRPRPFPQLRILQGPQLADYQWALFLWGSCIYKIGLSPVNILCQSITDKPKNPEGKFLLPL